MTTAARRVVLLVVVAVVACALPLSPLSPATPAAAACDGSALTAAQLDGVFAHPGIGASGGVPGYAGGDYQHTYPLPDGRVLWLFQDVFFSADDDLRDSLTAAAHNAGLVQDGSCFRILGAPGRSVIGNDLTVPMSRWFWPLDGDIGADGKLWVFVAEMSNPAGSGAGPGTRPVGTWIARIDTNSLAVVSFERAPDASADLYGWSVVSDRRWSYLVGHCYRQYATGGSGIDQFDPACMPDAHLARVPAGRFDAEPRYWTGNGWSRRSSAARPISTRGAANPMSIRHIGNRYVNVTKTDDWWGLWIHVDIAPTPMGPWETAQSIWIVGDRKCEGCGIYHAFAMRGLVQGRLVVSTSNGAPYELWYPNAWRYRPTFRSVAVPTYDTMPSLVGTAFIPRHRRTVLDTRESDDPVRVGDVRVVDVSGVVTPGATGARAIVSLVRPRRDVQVRAWACGTRPPVRATVAAHRGVTQHTTTRLRIDRDQRLCVATTARAQVRVEVAGSYVPT